MAPHVPEEVDVFTVPHSRMKALVDDYYNLVCNILFEYSKLCVQSVSLEIMTCCLSIVSPK